MTVEGRRGFVTSCHSDESIPAASCDEADRRDRLRCRRLNGRVTTTTTTASWKRRSIATLQRDHHSREHLAQLQLIHCPSDQAYHWAFALPCRVADIASCPCVCLSVSQLLQRAFYFLRSTKLA